jgi:ribosome-binding protein aMBF1 (putative translation factor)
MIKKKATDFDIFLAKQLKNKNLKKYFDKYGKQLEISYKISQLRRKKKISQKELAEKIGTTQSNVARMESGRQNFTVNFLSEIAAVLGSELKIILR